MGSTLDDVTETDSLRFRFLLRMITLAALVVFLAAAIVGAFDHPEEYTTEDGAVRVDYQGSVRSGNLLEVLVTFETAGCDAPVIALDRSYAAIINDLAVNPRPVEETSDVGGRLVWTFAESTSRVEISGKAAAGWNPPGRDVLTVECGHTYEVPLHTKRVP